MSVNVRIENYMFYISIAYNDSDKSLKKIVFNDSDRIVKQNLISTFSTQNAIYIRRDCLI